MHDPRIRRAMLLCLVVSLLGCDLFKDKKTPPQIVTREVIVKEEVHKEDKEDDEDDGQDWNKFPENLEGQEAEDLRAVFLGEIMEGTSRIVARVHQGQRVYIKLEAWEVIPHFYEETQTFHMAVPEKNGEHGYLPDCEAVFGRYTELKKPLSFGWRNGPFPVTFSIGTVSPYPSNLLPTGPVYFGFVDITDELLRKGNEFSYEIFPHQGDGKEGRVGFLGFGECERKDAAEAALGHSPQSFIMWGGQGYEVKLSLWIREAQE